MSVLSVPVICIDGPSGSGKGTLARNLANRLGFSYLDSGALYRVLAVLSARQNVDSSQMDKLTKIARNINVQFVDNQVLLDGVDLSPEVRLEETANRASQLAALSEVRAALVESQRQYAKAPGLVADGRDMGTVIFPEARLKVFLVASAEERAKRRLKQLEELQATRVQNGSAQSAESGCNHLKNKDLNHQERGDRLRALVEDIKSRDERDMSRKTSPLRPATDAVEIDCTRLSIDDVLNKVLLFWQQNCS